MWEHINRKNSEGRGAALKERGRGRKSPQVDQRWNKAGTKSRGRGSGGSTTELLKNKEGGATGDARVRISCARDGGGRGPARRTQPPWRRGAEMHVATPRVQSAGCTLRRSSPSPRVAPLDVSRNRSETRSGNPRSGKSESYVSRSSGSASSGFTPENSSTSNFSYAPERELHNR